MVPAWVGNVLGPLFSLYNTMIRSSPAYSERKKNSKDYRFP
jgi:hypothetical protein